MSELDSKAAVTGATGFLGLHLVDRLVRDGISVRALVEPCRGEPLRDRPGVEVVAADVRSPSDMDRALDGCTVVYHLAAQTSLVRSSRELFATNAEGTRNVASAAARSGVKRIVFTSNVSVHARRRGELIDEETPFAPNHPYSASKLRAEEILLEEHRNSGLGVVVARLGQVLGEGAVRWLGLLRALDTGGYRIVGSGSNRTQPADVSDVVGCLVRCACTSGIDGRAYLVAGSEPMSAAEFVETIAAELEVPVGRSRIPDALLTAHRLVGEAARRLGFGELPYHETVSFFTRDLAVDCSRARNELGYEPRVRLEDSIRSLVHWYRHGAHGL